MIVVPKSFISSLSLKASESLWSVSGFKMCFPIFLRGCFLVINSDYWFIKKFDGYHDINNSIGCFAPAKLPNLSNWVAGLLRCTSGEILLLLSLILRSCKGFFPTRKVISTKSDA